MLGILIMFGIAAGFYQGAKKRNLSGILYAVLALAVWYAAQIAAAYMKLEMDPYSSEMEIIAWGLGGSIVGVAVLYFIMVNAGNQKANQELDVSDDIMDDTFDDL